MSYIDMTGKRFGRWTVLMIDSEKLGGRIAWKCVCDCGTKRSVIGRDLRNGKSTSCGCISKEKTIQRSFKHGHAKRSGHNITYKSWSSMIERCTNPNSKVWSYYGGKGIKVCERWFSYSNFVEDMGERPSLKYSIDRIDPSGNYEPGNCRWADDYEQRINSRSGPKNTSGFVGVSWNSNPGRWHASIGYKGKIINLGYYISFEDAVKARIEGEKKYRGASNGNTIDHKTS